MGDALRLLAEVDGEAHAERIEIGVAGDLVVEARAAPGRLELLPFGALNIESERAIERELLASAPAIVLLDLTELEAADPAALRRLLARQRHDHRAGRELLLRIAPAQASALAVSADGAP